MFEKEAEENLVEQLGFDKEFIEQELNKLKNPNEKFMVDSLIREVKYAFQKGAEFGYNKANEWHKQEDDDIYDLIVEDWSIRYFICVMKDKNHVIAIGSCDEVCSGEVSVYLFFEHDDEKYHIDDIVWWKEIVLP